jgi:hypothetical protein
MVLEDLREILGPAPTLDIHPLPNPKRRRYFDIYINAPHRRPIALHVAVLLHDHSIRAQIINRTVLRLSGASPDHAVERVKQELRQFLGSLTIIEPGSL